MILTFCSVNDRVCLSLTKYAIAPSSIVKTPTNPSSKTFYNLCANSIPKPAPLNTNQLLTDPGPSDLLPTSHPCYYKHPWGIPTRRPRNGPYTDMCSGRSCTHSEHFDCELSVRLRNWMPKGTRYCRECVRFTKRVKSRRKGACESDSAAHICIIADTTQASAHDLPATSRVATIGATESMWATTETFGKFTTPRQIWQN